MKLLLTSAGIKNQSMINALESLLGKSLAESKLVFIPTAKNMATGDKRWFITDLYKCVELGFKEVDIADIAYVPKEIWLPQLENADVILVGGGNTSYLMQQVKKSGLDKVLPDLLKSRVYVGISAGSMIASPNLKEEEMQVLFGDPIVPDNTNEGLSFVDFLVVPHLNSPFFPITLESVAEAVKDINLPLYAIDDDTAIKVVDGNIEVISEGKWKKFN